MLATEWICLCCLGATCMLLMDVMTVPGIAQSDSFYSLAFSVPAGVLPSALELAEPAANGVLQAAGARHFGGHTGVPAAGAVVVDPRTYPGTSQPFFSDDVCACLVSMCMTPQHNAFMLALCPMTSLVCLLAISCILRACSNLR